MRGCTYGSLAFHETSWGIAFSTDELDERLHLGFSAKEEIAQGLIGTFIEYPLAFTFSQQDF